MKNDSGVTWQNMVVWGVAAVILAAFLIVPLEWPAIYGWLDDHRLISHQDRFTELYFDEYESLPRDIVSDRPLDFSFVIHNLNGARMSYSYSVSVEWANGNSESIASGEAAIADKEFKKVDISRSVNSQSMPGKVVVKLLPQNQQISFLLGKLP